ncbi:MAG: alpha/beta hydrolase [Rickettsiales bacterium]|nr:alpha/beta hydrolase [Rickettsiales bacterium]
MKKVFIFIAILTLTSCYTTNKDEKLQKKLKEVWSEYYNENFVNNKVVEVFVVTNRKSVNNSFSCDNTSFGVELNSEVKFGLCKINVPKNHDVGIINVAPNNIGSPDSYFKTIDAKAIEKDDFINSLKKSNRTALVFVHGFNVRYQEALLRAAQIAYDLKYQGPIVLFTWPSGAKEGILDSNLINKTYLDNQNNAKTSINIFADFLQDLHKNNIRINLVVHSMGHQVVLPALSKLGEKNSNPKIVNELILNAPDFGVSEFRTTLPNIKNSSEHITIYCSNNDKAMVASKNFNGGDRLGACSSIADLDIINVGLTDDNILGLGHSYYSSKEILEDISQNLLGISADKRLFIKKSEPFSGEKYLLRK